MGLRHTKFLAPLKGLGNLNNVANPSQSAKPRIVVIGGGFGGLKAARQLRNADASVTLIDRKNHHTFQPLLYQVATAGLSPGEIAAPIRWILHSQKNVEVLLGEVTNFDLERKIVKLADDEISYDYLIVAAGASHAYFGHDEWEPLAPGLKTIEDATEVRRRVLLAFELAERDAARGVATGELNFVVVGAGPTGVELAGTLAEIARHVLANEFRTIDPKHTRVLLVEGGLRLVRGQAVEPFHYHDKGSLATIGRAAAVADFGKLQLSGFFAWMAWLFIHILFLIGFRNRLMVMIQWAWSYITYERGARLITGDNNLPGWHSASATAPPAKTGGILAHEARIAETRAVTAPNT
jgi:NADH dehydrogenase FAD-containing subunit